jgi:peptide-methionine (R)-S-oxide reductase
MRNGHIATTERDQESLAMADKVTTSDAEWRKKLTPEQYHVTREKGTEPPFTGEYHDCKHDGV